MSQVGAQNQLINGNPSMTHFRSVYRRYTNFAMESIRMDFSSSHLDFNATQTRTLSCKIDRYAQLLHDTYLMITLPDIWSPMVRVSAPPAGYDPNCSAVGYEFQWIKNIGYNLIDHIDIVMNNVVIQTLTGEWLKMYSYMTHDAAKRRVVNQMVGNVPEVYDPANAYDRSNQYPHAVSPSSLPGNMPFTTTPEPSIRSRQLVIPLHFWFCENPGVALPLVSLQNSEVYINVTLRPLNQLYTVIDVNPANVIISISSVVSSGSSIIVTTPTPHGFSVGTGVTLQGLTGTAVLLTGSYVVATVPSTTSFTVVSTVTIAAGDQTNQPTATVGGSTNASYGQRIQPTGTYPIGLFLSPPTTTGLSSSSSVLTFYANPYLEGNFIYLTDMEMNQLATADQTFLLKQVRYTVKEGQYGANTDLEIPMFNMVTRIVFSGQRSDRVVMNDWDNYTNWANTNRAPFSDITATTGDLLYSSGQYQISSVSPRHVITDATLLMDGNERFAKKPTEYFSLIQQYKHTTGEQPSTLPGVYMYSFALNNDQYQPSGALNASMFNKIMLRISLQQPLPTSVGATQRVVCILKSTALSQNPLVISNPQARNPPTPADPIGSLIYPPDQLLSVVQTIANNNVIFSYTYNIRVYVESINYLRIVSGIANLVFAS